MTDRAEAIAESLQAVHRLEGVAQKLRSAVVVIDEQQAIPALVDDARQCLQVVLSNHEAFELGRSA